MTEEKIKQIKFRLIDQAVRKFPGDKKRQDAYIWGTIHKIKGK